MNGIKDHCTDPIDLQQHGYATLPGFHGNQLQFEFATREEAKSKKVDEQYQRLISILKINSYGECDFSLLIPVIISRRPPELEELSGDYTIDGQNKLVLYVIVVMRAMEKPAVVPSWLWIMSMITLKQSKKITR